MQQSVTRVDHHYYRSALLNTHRHTLDPKLQLHTKLQLNHECAAPRGPGYRWFILRFIKETGAPLKRDQSATRLEEFASNWPFIKKPSQVDLCAEISRVTTEPRNINYTTDEPHTPQLARCDRREAVKTHRCTWTHVSSHQEGVREERVYFDENNQILWLSFMCLNTKWAWQRFLFFCIFSFKNLPWGAAISSAQYHQSTSKEKLSTVSVHSMSSMFPHRQSKKKRRYHSRCVSAVFVQLSNDRRGILSSISLLPPREGNSPFHPFPDAL